MKLGLALGGGGAKGLAHIGILKVLEQSGIQPDMIVGTSMGALIGGAFCSGITSMELEALARSITKRSMTDIFIPNFFSSGLISQEKVRDYLENTLGSENIENLAHRFAAIATDIETGERVVFDSGDLITAVLASISIPVVFPPVMHGSNLLVDGGLVDPLPVQYLVENRVDITIGVNVIAPLKKRSYPQNSNPVRISVLEKTSLLDRAGDALKKLFERDDAKVPSSLSILLNTIDIMELQLTKRNIENFPPKFFITVDTSEFKVYEFYRAGLIIDKGIAAAEKFLPELKSVLNHL